MDFEHLKQIGNHWALLLPDTKGGKDQYVKIPLHVVESIQKVSELYGISKGPIWRSLSNNSRGKRLTARSIYRVVSKHSRLAGLTVHVGAHTLRHTGCTLAIEAGATVQQVQTHARHKNLETTMIYVHQRDKLADSAADFIDLSSNDGND